MSKSESKSTFIAPTFSWRFFHPKFWLTWLLVIILYSLSWLPYRLQLAMGRGIGRLLLSVLKKRKRIATKNIQLCFPDMSKKEVDQLVKVNFENAGIALFESGIAWWWPSWRANPICQVKGQEHIDAAVQEGKGIFLLFFHILPLEMMARVLGENGYPCVGFYRPHNNKLLEWVQYRGRCRSNRYMIGKRDVKGLLKALSNGEITVYLPDHDYGPKRSVFAPFFAVDNAATTTGTEIFASHKNAATIPTKLKRLPDNSGYEIEFLPPLVDYPSKDSLENAIKINKWVEEAVLDNMEQYMWVHRRFKTRPADEPESLY
ncbi:LpxL/LpxP family Kdo(2)-lipid IV(A) lauroyl/palmitoleoyl acyltransferase [Psychrosphaera sp.]|nr:LpxL/LpxP family Kdo(2)-lipid IV(A) lauroyl/palmitoleoyl acyltransferase [Psychrosphaera sp.]